MSHRRRRAKDFTDSLNSFHYTNSEISSDTLYSMSQDSLDNTRNKNYASTDTTYNSKHSIILAGSSSKHSSVQDTFISSITSSSAIQSGPDLNERIDSFQSEHLSNKIDDKKENNNPKCFRKDKELHNSDVFTTLANVPKIQISDEHEKFNTNTINEQSRRDSNYNIQSNKCNVISKSEQNIPKLIISEFISSPNCTNKDTQICDTNYIDNDLSNETKKFETLLCSLDNKYNQMKETSQSQILKHLSDEFVHAPTNFTEKLLTIIEESVMNNDDNSFDISGTNLSRLTTEFRKMCKFIEDESAPEWPPSPISTPPCSQQISTSPACNIKTPDIKTPKNEKLTSSINASVPTTPLSGIDIIKRRFFNKISKNHNGNSENLFNESTTSFECLEAQCKRLFPEEKEYCKPLRKSLSMPSLLSMNQIHHRCEQQMASLNISTTNENHKEKTIISAPNLLDKCLHQNFSINESELNHSELQEFPDQLKNTEYENMSYSKKKSKKISGKSDFSEVRSKRLTNNYAAVDPDELEKTLLQGIAEKRKRCLDTARLISEINKDPEAIEAQKTLKISPIYSKEEAASLSSDETTFLKTLMSCKDYQTYLKRRKPLFMLLQNSNISTPEISLKNIEKSDIECDTSNIKKTPCTKIVFGSPNTIHKSPLSEKQGEGKQKKEENIRPKLFVTPGKTPPNKDFKRKKVYFPNMNSPVENTTNNHILKSPHVKGLYRLNYNTVLSPIGMYIRGTDMQLIKNVHAKKDQLLLSPMKENVKPLSNRNTRQNSSPNSITVSQGKVPIKINLSPKVHKNSTPKQMVNKVKVSDSEDSTPKSHFVLPKVSYKLPLHVKTIKESKLPKAGTRVKKMLEAAQSKVVIRHHARTNSVQKKKYKTNGEIEIHYEPEDESIHIEQTAIRTNFIRKRTNI